MWTPLSRASGLDGVPQLRGSWGHWPWHLSRRSHRTRLEAPRAEPGHPSTTTGSSTPASPRSTRSSGRAACPKSASVAIRGDGSSGRTTLVAPARRGGPGAGLDRGLARPVAQLRPGRGGRPRRPARMARRHHAGQPRRGPLDRGLAPRRALGRPARPRPARRPAGEDRQAGQGRRPAPSARRARPPGGDLLLSCSMPPGLAGGLATAVAESTGLRLELARRSWIRLGRDIVGQRTEALVARNRYGPPGRRATLRILYAEGGERDACLRRDDLLLERSPADPAPATDSNGPTAMRLLHLYRPHLPLELARARASEPFPPGPLVLGGRPWDPGTVIDANPEARALGVRRGIPLGSAHRLAPEATFLDPDPDADRAAVEAAFEALAAFSPGIAGSDRPGRSRPSGCSRSRSTASSRCGAPNRSSSSGWPPRCARRASPGELAGTGGSGPGSPARASRRPSPRSTPAPDRPIVVPPGGEAAFLAPHPSGLLTQDPDVRARLDRFGLRRIGAVAELARSALVARFGEEGARIHARARGEETRAVPAAPDPRAPGPRPPDRTRRRRSSSRSASSSTGSPAP